MYCNDERERACLLNNPVYKIQITTLSYIIKSIINTYIYYIYIYIYSNNMSSLLRDVYIILYACTYIDCRFYTRFENNWIRYRSQRWKSFEFFPRSYFPRRDWGEDEGEIYRRISLLHIHTQTITYTYIYSYTKGAS
jgi:hypothetical protein